jgi:prevent-host-death family protein
LPLEGSQTVLGKGNVEISCDVDAAFKHSALELFVERARNRPPISAHGPMPPPHARSRIRRSQSSYNGYVDSHLRCAGGEEGRGMRRAFTIAEARNHLSEVVRVAEDEGIVELTRRGKTVAVVVSSGEFMRLSCRPSRPFEFLERLRAEHDMERYGLEPGDLDGVRDKTPGRDISL